MPFFRRISDGNLPESNPMLTTLRAAQGSRLDNRVGGVWWHGGSLTMATQSDPRDSKKPETRPTAKAQAERKTAPKPPVKKIYSDWAMI